MIEYYNSDWISFLYFISVLNKLKDGANLWNCFILRGGIKMFYNIMTKEKIETICIIGVTKN